MRVFLSACSLALLGLLCAPPAWAAGADPVALYGPEAVFDMVRSGEVIGQHRVAFEKRGGRVVARARTRAAVSVLGMTLYRFRHDSTAVWEGDRLVELRSRTDDDGAVSRVEARREDGRLVVDGPKGRTPAPEGLLEPAQWHVRALRDGIVLDPIDGTFAELKVRRMGPERLSTPGGAIEAVRYAVSGPREADLWYDATGRWVGLRVAAPDGSKVSYLCSSCAAGGSLFAAAAEPAR